MGMLRWLRRRLRCRPLVLALIALGVIGCYYLYVTSTCSEIKSRQFVTDLCNRYHDNKAAGSFCGILCDTGSLRYDQCTNYPGGKVVMFMTCEGCERPGHTSRVVLKSRSPPEEGETILRSQPPPAPKSDDDKEWNKYFSFIQSIVRMHFSNEFNDTVSQYEDITSFAWGWDFLQFIEKSKLSRRESSFLASDSLMSLIDQPEYLLTRYLQGRPYIPKIYGTCGNTYFVEYTETLNKFEFEFGFGASSWEDRAKLALKLIDMFRHLETDFKQPLHLCDVKPDNFGKGRNSRITIIDTDCVFFEDQLLKQMSNCSSHSDCDFFDCRGFCDLAAGRCKVERTNNNMQSLCEDVFQGFSPRIPSGLLRDPPADLRQDLYDALEACAYPDNHLARHTTRQKTPDIAVKKLEAIIRFGLQYGSYS